MKRVWLVDDKIPLHAVLSGPVPLRLEAELVRHVLESNPDAWEEAEVRDLCRALCTTEFEATFFLSPESMLVSFDGSAMPPHAIIFDWEYPGGDETKNLAALERVLRDSFTYVQVYTHLGEQAVETKLNDLREKYGPRLLPTRMKSAVAPGQLAEEIRGAWAGTIAGELADKVRGAALVAVERALVEMCSVPQGALAAMTEGRTENLVHIVLSKVREEIDVGASDALGEIVAAAHTGESSDTLRRLLSVWYYFFPSDNRVRRGDLIEIDGGLGLVVTPGCDLARFPKKAGSRLAWVRCVRMDEAGVRELRTAGLKFDGVGDSILARHGNTGDALVVLPNVPAVHGKRDVLEDYVTICHGWESRVFTGLEGGAATYDRLAGLRRRCTLAEPFVSAIVARVASVMSSPGTPDLPKAEQARLKQAVAPTPAAGR